MTEFRKVASREDLAPGQRCIVDLEGKEIALFNIDGEFFAIDNSCPHMDGPLGEGEVEGEHVTCPWHAWTFNIKSGACETMPGANVGCYEVKVDGEDILVALTELR